MAGGAPGRGLGGGGGSPRRASLRRRFGASLVLALVVYAGLAIYADLPALAQALAVFPWTWLPAVLALTLVNYGGRLVKWHWYLGLVGAPLGWRDSARVFGAGMTMVMTPGKVGELLKSLMVRQLTGVPMRVTAPIVLAERLTDGLAMLALAGAGLAAFGDPPTRRLTGLVALALLAAVAVVQVRPLALGLLAAGARLPGVGRAAGALREAYESGYTLLRPRNLAVAVAIGVVSWCFEGLAYGLVLVGVGAPATVITALQAVFVFSVATIVGALIATPGGLGGTEGSLVTLTTLVVGLARTPAVAAAFVVRLATLWFGVAIGLACLARWPELLSGAEEDLVPAPEA